MNCQMFYCDERVMIVLNELKREVAIKIHEQWISLKSIRFKCKTLTILTNDGWSIPVKLKCSTYRVNILKQYCPATMEKQLRQNETWIESERTDTKRWVRVVGEMLFRAASLRNHTAALVSREMIELLNPKLEMNFKSAMAPSQKVISTWAADLYLQGDEVHAVATQQEDECDRYTAHVKSAVFQQSTCTIMSDTGAIEVDDRHSVRSLRQGMKRNKQQTEDLYHSC